MEISKITSYFKKQYNLVAAWGLEFLFLHVADLLCEVCVCVVSC